MTCRAAGDSNDSLEIHLYEKEQDQVAGTLHYPGSRNLYPKGAIVSPRIPQSVGRLSGFPKEYRMSAREMRSIAFLTLHPGHGHVAVIS